MYHVDFVKFCFRDDLETWVTLDKNKTNGSVSDDYS